MVAGIHYRYLGFSKPWGGSATGIEMVAMLNTRYEETQFHHHKVCYLNNIHLPPYVAPPVLPFQRLSELHSATVYNYHLLAFLCLLFNASISMEAKVCRRNPLSDA